MAMMNRQLLRTLRPARNQLFSCSHAVNNVVSIHRYNSTRLALSPLIANKIPKTHVNLIPSTPFSTDAETNSSPPKKKVGIISRIRNALRTIFGSNDDTPRGIQEKKDMYWILLAVAHRQLRMEAQQQQQQLSSSSSNNNDPMTWDNESKDQIKQYMEEAASYLDEQTDISEMSLRKLRQEVQSRLEPQIVQLLNVACNVEEDMILRHSNNNSSTVDENDDNYEFSDAEATECKGILLQEHDRLCKIIQNAGASDATEYYKLKKSAIETLLQYFDWMPQNTPLTDAPNPHPSDDEDYVDEFGFYPNRSEAETVSAIRY